MHYGLNGYRNKTNIQAHSPAEKPKLVGETSQPTFLAGPGKASFFDLCPSCGETSLAHEEGCKKCYGCGYSEC